MENIYDKWNIVKKDISTINKKSLHFREREIYHTKIGENIGSEQNGKGSEFLRPVLVLRKYNTDIFTGIPLTNNIQYSQFTYIFSFQEGKESCALLSQVKIYDAKRLKRKIGIIDNDSFKNLKDKLKILLKL